MSQTFEEWLAATRKRNENVIAGEKIVEGIRQHLRQRIISYFDDTKDQVWCNCDTCILIRMTADDKYPDRLKEQLAYIGLEYLLGENFNGSAALSYHQYIKEVENEN
jgi:hypothetical protein